MVDRLIENNAPTAEAAVVIDLRVPATPALQDVPSVAPAPETDGIAELLLLCSAGDRGAWNRIVTRYERLVHAIPLREGLGPDDAAEVAQAVFAGLIDQVDRLREPERLTSWLMTVARRETWKLVKQRSCEEPIEDIPPLDIHRAHSDDQDAWVRATEVHDALAQLHEPCRALITGLFLDPGEPTYQELATILGRPIGSLGPMRARCLARMREVMEGDER